MICARDGNHVKSFVAECCMVGVAEDWSVSETIFAAYLSYCASNGQPSHLPKNVLSSTICNMGIGVSAKRGEDRPKPGDESKPTGKRDSTVITIGRVHYNELDLPRIEVVPQVW